MSNVTRVFLMLCIAGAMSLLTRALPFLSFRRGNVPSFVLYLGKVLPMAVMCILVLYCIKGTNFQSAVGFLPQTVGLAAVTGLQLWKRSSTLSIFGGTAIYMILLRLL